MAVTAVELGELEVRYNPGGQPQLRCDSLSLHRGEIAVLSGPSGCGKSTLLKTLKGFIPHHLPGQVNGRVSVLGREPSADPAFACRSEVAYLFQVPETQLFNLSVAEEIAFGLHLQGCSAGVREAWVAEAAERLGIGPLLVRPVQQLSSGEKQKVALAALLATHPDLLLLDEPYAFLDAASGRSLTEWLSQLGGHLSIMVAEHRLNLVGPLAARGFWLEGGSIAERSALTLPPLPASPVRPAPGSPVVRLEGVSAGYPGRPVLQGIDLSIGEGEWVALLGPNGSGKSTLGKVALGHLRPLKGRIWRATRRVGVVFPNPYAQCLTASVEEELEFARAYGRRRDRFGSVRSASTPRGGSAAAMAASLGLGAHLHDSPYTLSVGQAGRLVVGANLMLRPELLVLDEPTAGLDRENTLNLVRLIHRYAEAAALPPAVLLITHDEELARWSCHRIIRLEGGQVVGEEAVF